MDRYNPKLITKVLGSGLVIYFLFRSVTAIITGRIQTAKWTSHSAGSSTELWQFILGNFIVAIVVAVLACALIKWCDSDE